MKNKMQIAIALGLMCILLTSAIVIQLNTIKEEVLDYVKSVVD